MPVVSGSERLLLLEMHEVRRGSVHSNEAFYLDLGSPNRSISGSQISSPGRRYSFDWSQSVSIGMLFPMPSSHQTNATKGRLMDTAFRDKEIDLESFSRLVVEVKQSSKVMSSRDDISRNGPEVQVPCTPSSFVQVLCTPDLATTCSSKSLGGKVQVHCTPSFVNYCMSRTTRGVAKSSTSEQYVSTCFGGNITTHTVSTPNSYYEWDYVGTNEKQYATFSLVEGPRGKSFIDTTTNVPFLTV